MHGSDMVEAIKRFVRFHQSRKEAKEADGGSSFPQALRATESNPEPQTNLRFRESATFQESESSATADQSRQSRFSAIIIQEGMGNFGDGFYYTREAIEGAASLFEGKKIYADHPTLIEEQVIPERSVRDILGHFENVRSKEMADGHVVLEADLVILAEPEFDWARGLMKHAIEYGKKYKDRDFVGLSINANGQAEPKEIDKLIAEAEPPAYCLQKLERAKAEGIAEVRLVTKLTDAISCDLVTEAGAGGRLTKLLEGELMKAKKKTKEAQHPACGDEPKVGAQVEAADHADAAQDMELIKAMLKKHMGGDQEPEEADCSMAKECYEMAKEMGLQGEEAEKMAMAGMKMAKKIAEKYKAEPAKEQDVHVDVDSHKGEEEPEAEEEPEVEAKKESAKPADDSEATRLRGENAALKQKLSQYEMGEYLDKKLTESGYDRKVTKAFREGIKISDLKSTAEIDTKWENFIEGFKAARQLGGSPDIIIATPKVGAPSGGSLDLSDCLGFDSSEE